MLHIILAAFLALGGCLLMLYALGCFREGEVYVRGGSFSRRRQASAFWFFLLFFFLIGALIFTGAIYVVWLSLRT